jgi:Zn-dependent peptidase ImmA (M78 family)
MKSNEFVDDREHDGLEIEDFIRWVCTKLMIKIEMPDITYSRDKESEDQDRTGYYNAETNHMWIYTGHRNLVDIMRTVAHELSHHKQKLDGHTSANTPIANLETQADMAAGMLMKIWVRKHPEIIQ